MQVIRKRTLFQRNRSAADDCIAEIGGLVIKPSRLDGSEVGIAVLIEKYIKTGSIDKGEDTVTDG